MVVGASQSKEKLHGQACDRVRSGDVPRARQTLTSQPLAPGNSQTLQELTDPTRRPNTPARRTPQSVLDFIPEVSLQWDPLLFLQNVRSANRGSAPSPSGMRSEHLQTCLDDEDIGAMLAQVGEKLAHGDVPFAIVGGLRLGRLTALQKDNGRVRGITTVDIFRHLVARTLAQTYSEDIEEACSPFQFALSTRAGTDCVGLLTRATPDMDKQAVVVSIDGVGAYDHVHRASMLGKLQTLSRACAVLPFVRLFYVDASRYLWSDDAGQLHTIRQAEGGEQGGPLDNVVRIGLARRFTVRSRQNAP